MEKKTIQEKATLKNLTEASNEMLAIANVHIRKAYVWYAKKYYDSASDLVVYDWESVRGQKNETAVYTVNIVDLPNYVGIINTFVNKDNNSKRSYMTLLNKDQSDLQEYKTVEGKQVLSKTHHIHKYECRISKDGQFYNYITAVITYDHLLQEPVNTEPNYSKKERCIVYRWSTINPDYVPTKEQAKTKKAAKPTASVDKALITAESEKARVAAKKATK